ncbi:MAG: 3-phosphoshikimate 1-carboxyvinyltransferase [Ruminococcus sp.]
MKVTVYPSKLKGSVDAIASKSLAHRLLICAALSEGVTKVKCPTTSEDIEATVACLKALGSNIIRIGDSFLVPKVTASPCSQVTLNCNESGTTLRLMLCICAGLGLRAKFDGSDKLFSRPLIPLVDVLTSHGMVITRDENNRILQSGIVIPGEFTISGEVSSQFISGLMMMIPLCKGQKSKLIVTGELQSKPYVDLTVSALRLSGVDIAVGDNTYDVSGEYQLSDCTVEGDWSNSSFWLAAGALGDRVEVKGLKNDSAQGDMAILSILRDFGAEVEVLDKSISAEKKALNSVNVYAQNIPDAVPIISVIASLSKGKTVITGVERLRLKESDRISTVTNMINALGGSAETCGDSIVIEGKERLSGGTVKAERDHRIAMSAAIASLCCDSPVIIEGAEAVNKSYPTFFEDFIALGGKVKLEE